MDWNNKDRATLPSMEFSENPNELIVQLINRMTDLEILNAQFQSQIDYLRKEVEKLKNPS